LAHPSHDEHPHVPGPSLWPVGFAVGIVVLLVGLIVSWYVAALGAILALVFGFLWVRDLTAGTQLTEAEEVAPEGAVTVVESEELPPEDPADRYPRSKFLEISTLGLGAVIGGLVTVPVLGFMVAPAFLKQGDKDHDLGPLNDFTEGKFIITTYMTNPTQGAVSRRTAFIRNNGPLNGVPDFTVISNRCAHVGCPVQPGGPVFQQQEKTVTTKNGKVLITPVLPAAGFICPCHGGSYDQEGNRIAGPPVRGLDRYDFAVVNGRLVLGNLYSVAKVDGAGKTAKIHKVELHGPGQHVDGPESWLYPVQPPH